jgi:hypothetical protein
LKSLPLGILSERQNWEGRHAETPREPAVVLPSPGTVLARRTRLGGDKIVSRVDRRRHDVAGDTDHVKWPPHTVGQRMRGLATRC